MLLTINRKEVRLLMFVPLFLSMMFLFSRDKVWAEDNNDKAALAEKANKAEQDKINDMKSEIELGRNMAGRLVQYYGIYLDEQLLGYVNQVGINLASQSQDNDRRYMFEILDNDMINAFAAPGGYILISRGALKHARNEAELAGVLAHEIAHVYKRHMFNTLKSMSKEEMEKAGGEVESFKDFPPAMKARRRPVPKDSETGAMLARYLSGGTINILAAAKAGMSLYLEKGLKPELEYEADSEGAKLAVQAGYDPYGLPDFLCRIDQAKEDKSGKCKLIRKDKKDKNLTILAKTHPPIIDRVESVNKVLDKMNAATIIGAKGINRYAMYTKKLPEPKKKQQKTH
ncbi:MAG: M48 family metalloprotease [Oligoflexales bacterium]|nr:M48 family metalloprotease [Oligoflexales bacterium]